ncbi:class A beta-lactamase-related serine hydrolase [Bosea caraganae]|uniref:Class A beta-lactamase-related serine hydrolase n=1 Tax=Bosea caraganae TaxID=2763117 RepID=A0A370LBW8_9HYPH|nr:serine hydrolase domain-containing protein [Bosea caraganae]RDJ27457.1 class A beta-lactamase-related serine hydrolase [Bosea caraganae]RDJ29473.1 class A beta-lactamase-related serine hydrolase [Bosea caraganae]
MTPWLPAALAYVSSWIEFQRRHHDQPGCAIAIASGDKVVLEAAFGHADLATGEELTPRHGFRIASHSKSFTSAGLLRLIEAGRLRLDDKVGSYVQGLHQDVAAATIGQVLSNSAGLTRDGPDNGQFFDRKPYCSKEEVLADLSVAQPYPASQRFKYSNHGFALLGMVIEAVTGEAYPDWIAREVVAAVGLTETQPDISLWSGPMAKGHSGKAPLGRRVVIPADNPGNAMVSAAGFVATAADVVRYFAQLSPKAERSILSPLSRREMSRRLWPDSEGSLGRHYGLGTISGGSGDWEWFAHSGGFQGVITRTAVLPRQDLTITVLTNAIDGLAHPWLDGIIEILKTFQANGAPSPATEGWSGRWWTIWGCGDLVPFESKVLVANPALFNPFLDASEIAIEGKDRGQLVKGSGFNSPGEAARLVRGADGKVESVWLGGAHVVSEEALRVEMLERYGKTAG